MPESLIPDLAPFTGPNPTDYYQPAPGGIGVSVYVPYTPEEWRALRAATLNRVARTAAARAQTVAGAGSLLRIPFGRCYGVGAQLLRPLVFNLGQQLVVACVWATGGEEGIDAITAAYMDGEPLPDTVTATHYLGTPSQTVDPTLVAAFAENGIAFTDAMPGAVYSVFVVPREASSGFPAFTVDLRGLKVRVEEGGAREYSENDAYCIAAFIESTVYGMKAAVDWETVQQLASVCDQVCGDPGEPRHVLGLLLDSPQPVETWLAALCEYAGAKAIPEGGKYLLLAEAASVPVYRVLPDGTRRELPDGTPRWIFLPGAAEMSFTTANIVAGSLRLITRTMRDSPTVVEVTYTELAANGVAQDSTLPARAERAGVEAGTLPERMTRLSMPGFTRHSEANRYAIQRVNAAELEDLTATFQGFDECAALRSGTLIDITHPVGLVGKKFRVAKCAPAGPGRWAITATEYDPAKFSSVVVEGPSVVDTPLPSPANPPALGAITLAEVVYQLQDGTYASRIVVSWSAPSYPQVDHYRIDVRQSAALVFTGTADRTATTWASGPVQEGVAYQVDVRIVTVIASGQPSSATITARGKLLPPGDVPALRGFEAGGKVYLNWDPAVDIDIWRYELGFWPVGQTWDDRTVIDRVDGLRYVAEGLATGTWVFGVKAIDSVRQYSANAATATIVISSDAGAFITTSHTFSSPTLSNMTDELYRDGSHRYVTDFGDELGFGADDPDDTVGTFGDSLVTRALAAPHTPGTSSFVTEAWDLGVSTAGNFTFLPSYLDVEGTADVYVETSPDGSSWTPWAGGSARTTARYLRGRIETTGTMVVRGAQAARVDVVPRQENGIAAVGSSGPTTITLTGTYSYARSIGLTPAATAPRIAVYDNIVVGAGTNSFDVYLFDATFAQVAGDVSWNFQGV